MVTHNPADAGRRVWMQRDTKKTDVLGIAELRYPVSPQEGMETASWICHTPSVSTNTQRNGT